MQALLHETKRDARPVERRKAERRPGRGRVRFFVEGPPPAEVKGRLVDVSESSFRAAHGYRALQAGQEVRYLHSKRVGLARVIWNRIVGKNVETGFFILT
jgi:hypothetical protein